MVVNEAIVIVDPAVAVPAVPRPNGTLMERASVKKASADAIFSTNKLQATPLYVASQLLIVEHVQEVVEDQEEKAQQLLLDVIKTLKFCARTYIKHDHKRSAAVVYAYCAVVQTNFMRCRWAHYDVLRKNLLDGKTANIDKFKDMMHGVDKMFDSYRTWKSATDADINEANCLANWSVVSIPGAHRIVRNRLKL
jgi:hypothetical protein